MERTLRLRHPSLVRDAIALTRPSFRPSITCLFQRTSPFSSTPALGKKGQVKKDPRITLIRYFLQHPLTPRPLRFSRLRYLRHWTIHRAWQLFRAKQRRDRELELEKQYNSMREACEALRLMDGNGMTIAEGGEGPGSEGIPAGAMGKDVGRLYRLAMSKRDIWQGVPIEYARIQTDSPPRDGWNHEWTR